MNTNIDYDCFVLNVSYQCAALPAMNFATFSSFLVTGMIIAMELIFVNLYRHKCFLIEDYDINNKHLPERGN